MILCVPPWFLLTISWLGGFSQHNTEYIVYNDILHISIWNTTRVNIVSVIVIHEQFARNC